MSNPEDPAEWQAWIEQACRALGVDPRLVDTDAVLGLTRTVAQRLARPMAPVAAHILGLAIGAQGAVQTGRLIDALASTLPPATDEVPAS